MYGGYGGGMYGRSMYGGYGGMYGGYGGYGGMYGGGMYGGMMGPGMGSSYAESMFRMTQMLEMNSILSQRQCFIFLRETVRNKEQKPDFTCQIRFGGTFFKSRCLRFLSTSKSANCMGWWSSPQRFRDVVPMCPPRQGIMLEQLQEHVTVTFYRLRDVVEWIWALKNSAVKDQPAQTPDPEQKSKEEKESEMNRIRRRFKVLFTLLGLFLFLIVRDNRRQKKRLLDETSWLQVTQHLARPASAAMAAASAAMSGMGGMGGMGGMNSMANQMTGAMGSMGTMGMSGSMGMLGYDR